MYANVKKSALEIIFVMLILLCTAVYAQKSTIVYTVNVNLPEADTRDVPFTIYVKADGTEVSQKGSVKSGEKSAAVKVENVPVSREYTSRIEFDYHKYKNAVLEDFLLWSGAAAADLETNFTAEYSRAVVCDVSLPDNYVPEGDVEVKVQLSKYVRPNTLAVVDNLTDWTDGKTIILNGENRTEKVTLYSQASSSKLSYKITDGGNGLCEKGYWGGKPVSTDDCAIEIKENLSAEMTLLRKKNVPVTIYRPIGLSVDKDVFASVILEDTSPRNNDYTVMDFTKTPLISAGMEKTQFYVEVAEDKNYYLNVENIKGDEHLFNYYCYVKALNSPAGTKGRRTIGFADNKVSFTLLTCNNISGKISCEDTALIFDAEAVCTLYNGTKVILLADMQKEKFNIKIPEDADTYTLNVYTILGVKSWYVSDGVSTNDETSAEKIDFVYDDDKNIVLKYIVQNQAQPIGISAEKDCFELKNISDYEVGDYVVYVACYDKNGKLLSADMNSGKSIKSGGTSKLPFKSDNYKIKKIKVMTWKDDMTPFGNTAEKYVNQPYIPEEEGMPFWDVEYGSEIYNAVMYVYTHGIAVGYEDGSFKTGETVFRSEAAVMFSRAMGHEYLNYEFSCADVPSTHWVKSWLGICINEKVFELEDNKFRPDDNLTVREAVISTLKMIGKYSADYAETAKRCGLLKNIADDNLDRDITRAELAQLLYNADKI